MKERAASAIYHEKVCLHLQCNYKQLRLNFSTLKELSLVIYGYGFPQGKGTRGWGVDESTVKPPGTEKPKVLDNVDM